jgi:hypothetical protein
MTTRSWRGSRRIEPMSRVIATRGPSRHWKNMPPPHTSSPVMPWTLFTRCAVATMRATAVSSTPSAARLQ